jgi:hypothetical protein
MVSASRVERFTPQQNLPDIPSVHPVGGNHHISTPICCCSPEGLIPLQTLVPHPVEVWYIPLSAIEDSAPDQVPCSSCLPLQLLKKRCMLCVWRLFVDITLKYRRVGEMLNLPKSPYEPHPGQA